MASILKKDLPVAETSTQVWEALWPQEKRRQVSISYPDAVRALVPFLNIPMLHVDLYAGE